MKQAYYAAALASFLKEQRETILGHLAAKHLHDLDLLQRNAWIEQITLLQNELREFGDGWIGLEFAIPRMGKRVERANETRESTILLLERGKSRLFHTGLHENARKLSEIGRGQGVVTLKLESAMWFSYGLRNIRAFRLKASRSVPIAIPGTVTSVAVPSRSFGNFGCTLGGPWAKFASRRSSSRRTSGTSSLSWAGGENSKRNQAAGTRTVPSSKAMFLKLQYAMAAGC
jgi:hypothetical protein